MELCFWKRLPPQLRRSKVLKAISVALLYGYCDYALDIAQNAGDALSADDKSAIEGSLKQAVVAAPLQALPGRRYVAAALYPSLEGVSAARRLMVGE